MKYRLWIPLALLLTLLAGVAAAQSLSDIKERMKDRLPEISDLKARGIVGENNTGFLEFVGDKKEKEGVVEGENADRAAVYQHIAQQQGASAALVGKRRAAQIRQTAPSGVWLQDENGEWFQK
jgi:uncharacterized protein YdbL (DUF1318 family)